MNAAPMNSEHALAQGDPSVIMLQAVSKRFGSGVAALDQVSLRIRSGEFVVIVGPSGAGKSTLLRCINFLVPPTSGRVFVAGNHVRGRSGRELRALRMQVGMIFQQFGLVGRLSVLSNVLSGRLRFHSMPHNAPTFLLGWTCAISTALALLAVIASAWVPIPALATIVPAITAAISGSALLAIWLWTTGRSVLGLFSASDRQEAMRCLQLVGIDHLAFRRADRLSGGQQQRVAIARALAQQPQVVLADEPIASLDPVSSTAVMDALRTINSTLGIPVLVNLHQVDVARSYATRIIGMSAGRIVFDGPPQELTPDVIDRIYSTSAHTGTMSRDSKAVRANHLAHEPALQTQP